MSGKYRHRESAPSVACPIDFIKPSNQRHVPSSESWSVASVPVHALVGALLATVAAVIALVTAVQANAEGRPQQMEFSRAPAPVAEQNAELTESREADHCADCGSQAKILLAWDYPAVDEFLVFYGANPNAEFTQLTPVAPVIRAPNGEYEIEIDAGLELGAAIGEQVCFRIQAASVTGDFVSAGEDTAASAVVCSELQS